MASLSDVTRYYLSRVTLADGSLSALKAEFVADLVEFTSLTDSTAPISANFIFDAWVENFPFERESDEEPPSSDLFGFGDRI